LDASRDEWPDHLLSGRMNAKPYCSRLHIQSWAIAALRKSA